MQQNKVERIGLKFGASLTWIGAGLGAALIFLPILGLIGRVKVGGIDFAVWQAIRLSLTTTSYSMILILLFGTPLAWILAKENFQGRRALNALIELPIVLPPAVAGLALLVTFGRRGLIGASLDEYFGIRLAFTSWAVVFAQTFVALPFYVRSAQLGFSDVDAELEDAARVDGASGWDVFIRISAPLASRAILSGGILSWARALGEFGATIIFAGNLAGETRTMPLLVYTELERDLQSAIWTGLILLIFAGVAVLSARLLSEV